MKAVVSVIGTDKKGIIAKVSGVLYNNNINISDISQTIMANKYFTMIMMVDTSDSSLTIKEIDTCLQEIASELSVEIRIQNEDIFNIMR